MLINLFLGFLQIGFMSIGGGYAAMPLIQAQAVEENQWLTMKEFADLVTIAEMTPGPIGINAATFVGIRIAGPLGAITAAAGFLLPSIVIVSLLFFLYRKYRTLPAVQAVLKNLRPVMIALIGAAGIKLLMQVVFQGKQFSLQDTDLFCLFLFAAALFSLRKWKPNPVKMLFICGAAGLGAGILGIL